MPVLEAERVAQVLARGSSARVDTAVAPRFVAGDFVRTRNLHPTGHTRLPRYARDKRGVIAVDHGVFVFPDAHAHSQATRAQHCYSVRFTGRELWGPHGDPNSSVYIDLWDDHLEPA